MAPIGDADRVVQQLVGRLCDVHSSDIDDAHQIDIVASLDELGRQAQRFPRTIEPLRWKYEASGGVVRLVDETDHNSPLKVNSYALTTPLAMNEVSSPEALAGFALEAPGMLLTAQYKELDASILVSVAAEEKLKNLADLGITQNVDLQDDNGPAVMQLIDAMRRWKSAKPVGYWGVLPRYAFPTDVAPFLLAYHHGVTIGA